MRAHGTIAAAARALEARSDARAADLHRHPARERVSSSRPLAQLQTIVNSASKCG
ncbi:MAG: hypothetical protein M5U08_02405 [Burkholderiales bacterium]|nr:hypothetical protein [Burkholderiales bacterium]